MRKLFVFVVLLITFFLLVSCDSSEEETTAEEDATTPVSSDTLITVAPVLTSLDSFYSATCNCYEDIPYGSISWIEPTIGDLPLSQDFNLYPQTSDSVAPLVIYTHPNSTTKDFNSSLVSQIVQPALNKGFAVISLEFRHPVVNVTTDVPHFDIARGIQYIRYYADILNIDPERIFSLARSRGSLAIWTAVQDDMKDPNSSDPVSRMSTRILAVFGIQAQGTYDSDEYNSLFIDSSLHSAYLNANPNNDAFGHTIGDITLDDPPLKLRYQDPLETLPISSAAELCSTTGEDPGSSDCIDLKHLPNAGEAICNAYASAGIPSSCEIEYSVDSSQYYNNYIDFFLNNL